tara:strand:- start:121 stop:507 length:387 start_codon:yes stop_codon:yes gene_type:complete
MSKTIYLVRHGKYAQESLVEDGRQQIQRAARTILRDLKGLKHITIYHSPITRARESAEVLAETLRAKMNISLEERDTLAQGSYLIHKVVEEITEKGIIVSHLLDLQVYMEQQGIETTFRYGQVRRVII